MGFQTIAMLLNDQMDMMEKCPHAFTYLLTHPPMSVDDENSCHLAARSVAIKNNENWGGICQITVMPSFHADGMMFYLAGGNSIDRCENVTYGMRKGKKVAIVELPEWMQKDDRFVPRHGMMIPKY